LQIIFTTKFVSIFYLKIFKTKLVESMKFFSSDSSISNLRLRSFMGLLKK